MSLRVLIVPDKFKGTLTGRQAAAAIVHGWRQIRPQDRLKVLPMSDGGDGFGQVLGDLLGAQSLSMRTVDAAHRPCRSTWEWVSKTKTAVIESARVIGLAMLPPRRYHPFNLDTFGLGAMLRAARQKGAKRCVVGIGGSASNDGGFGMARALGWKFLNRARQPIHRWIHLDELCTIEPPEVPCQFEEMLVAVDVQNPLLGPRGATRVYGPQKGLAPRDFKPAEKALARLAQVVRRHFGRDFAVKPGAGAAGGLGFGLSAFCSAQLNPGFELFARSAKLDQCFRRVDLVITGEGMIDDSTLMGKGVGEIVFRCRKEGLRCLGLGAQVKHSPKVDRYFSEVHALTDLTSIKEAKSRPAFWLRRLAKRAAINIEASAQDD